MGRHFTGSFFSVFCGCNPLPMKYDFHTLWLLAILFLLAFTWLVSPYNYEWEPDLKQRDEDAILSLWFLYFVVSFMISFGWWAAASNKHRIKWLYPALLAVAVARMVSLWWVK